LKKAFSWICAQENSREFYVWNAAMPKCRDIGIMMMEALDLSGPAYW